MVNLLYFIPALRILLGILYIITSALKFPNLKGFAVIVASYNLLPRSLVKPAAYIQPFVEFAVGWWILSGKQLFYAAFAGLLLMIIADIFIIKGLLAKKRMENCGCYGANISVPLTWKKLAENLIWTALFIILMIAAKQLEAFM
ncbi:MAG: MauE/DoxX family redox-associated membrane protein [Candidatus Woesearchaeota archaeon]